MATPWIREGQPESPIFLSDSENGKAAHYQSHFAFYGLVKYKKYLAVILRQIVLKNGQTRPVDFEIVIEHRWR